MIIYFTLHSEEIPKTGHSEERRVQYCSVEVIAEAIKIPARHFHDFRRYAMAMDIAHLRLELHRLLDVLRRHLVAHSIHSWRL